MVLLFLRKIGTLWRHPLTPRNVFNFVFDSAENDDEWKGWQRLGDPVLHIELRNWADVLLVAPLSAHTLAKFANGLCDDTLSCVARAWNFGYTRELMDGNIVNAEIKNQLCRKPMILAPAMNTAMWEHPITQLHLQAIQSFFHHYRNKQNMLRGTSDEYMDDGVIVVPPQSKELACGEIGNGALASLDTILDIVTNIVINRQ
jgi:phosphopantothenoylcysteine decarboxylase